MTFMLYSERIDSCPRIARAFHQKKGRWPTHLELLEYVVQVHSVKPKTAKEYIMEALAQKKLKDTVAHLEAT